MKHQLRLRANEKEWHKLPIIKWYDSKKAVRTQFGNFRMNMSLNNECVRIMDNDYIEVIGYYINKTADANLKSYYEWKAKN